MSVKKILSKVVHIIVPIIIGTSIELYSFSKIAVFVFLLSLIQIIVTLLIKTEEKEYTKAQYSFKSFLNHIKNKKLKSVRLYGLSGIAYGIVESSIGTLIIIITIMTFKTSINLGILTTVFAVCSIFSLILYNKFYNKNSSKIILTLCSIIVLIGVLGLMFDINKLTLIIYNFCYIITFSIFDAVYNTKKRKYCKRM